MPKSKGKPRPKPHDNGKMGIGPHFKFDGRHIALPVATNSKHRGRRANGEAYQWHPVVFRLEDTPFHGVILSNTLCALFLLDYAAGTKLLSNSYAELARRYPTNFHPDGHAVMNMPPQGVACTAESFDALLESVRGLGSPLHLLSQAWRDQKPDIPNDHILQLCGYRYTSHRNFGSPSDRNINVLPWVISSNDWKFPGVEDFCKGIFQKSNWVKPGPRDLPFESVHENPNPDDFLEPEDYLAALGRQNAWKVFKESFVTYDDGTPLGCKEANHAELYWLSIRFPRIKKSRPSHPDLLRWPNQVDFAGEGIEKKSDDIIQGPNIEFLKRDEIPAAYYHKMSKADFDGWTDDIFVLAYPLTDGDPAAPAPEPGSEPPVSHPQNALKAKPSSKTSKETLKDTLKETLRETRKRSREISTTSTTGTTPAAKKRLGTDNTQPSQNISPSPFNTPANTINRYLHPNAYTPKAADKAPPSVPVPSIASSPNVSSPKAAHPNTSAEKSLTPREDWKELAKTVFKKHNELLAAHKLTQVEKTSLETQNQQLNIQIEQLKAELCATQEQGFSLSKSYINAERMVTDLKESRFMDLERHFANSIQVMQHTVSAFEVLNSPQGNRARKEIIATAKKDLLAQLEPLVERFGRKLPGWVEYAMKMRDCTWDSYLTTPPTKPVPWRPMLAYTFIRHCENPQLPDAPIDEELDEEPDDDPDDDPDDGPDEGPDEDPDEDPDEQPPRDETPLQSPRGGDKEDEPHKPDDDYQHIFAKIMNGP